MEKGKINCEFIRYFGIQNERGVSEEEQEEEESERKEGRKSGIGSHKSGRKSSVNKLHIFNGFSRECRERNREMERAAH